MKASAQAGGVRAATEGGPFGHGWPFGAAARRPDAASEAEARPSNHLWDPGPACSPVHAVAPLADRRSAAHGRPSFRTFHHHQ